jgi:hypothetical protein
LQYTTFITITQRYFVEAKGQNQLGVDSRT